MHLPSTKINNTEVMNASTCLRHSILYLMLIDLKSTYILLSYFYANG